MRTLRHWVRLPITLAVSYLALTAMLWHAPGRGLDETLWGQSSFTKTHESDRQWNSYGHFTAWYAGELWHGRAGNSAQFGVPVEELISERAPVSIGNAWRGFVAAWIVAVAASIASHFWPAIGKTALGAGSLLLSLPSAFVVLSLVLGGGAPWAGLAACIWPKAYYHWETILVSGRRRPHVLALLAQGAGPWRVQWHAINYPNLRRFLGLLAVTVPMLLGALIPVEVLCDQPGLGQLAWRAVTARDLPLLTSLTLLFTAVTTVMGLLAESLQPEAR